MRGLMARRGPGVMRRSSCVRDFTAATATTTAAPPTLARAIRIVVVIALAAVVHRDRCGQRALAAGRTLEERIQQRRVVDEIASAGELGRAAFLARGGELALR